MATIYTHENWNLFLETYFPGKKKGEVYDILGPQIGFSGAYLKTQCAPGKDLPAWAKGFIFSFLNFPDVAAIKKNLLNDFSNFLNVHPEPVESSETLAEH